MIISALKKYLPHKHLTFNSYVGNRVELMDRYKYTPDIHLVQSYFRHNIFIYNQYQSGQRSNRNLGAAVKLAGAFTQSDRFVMWKNNLGKETFPFSLLIQPDQMFGKTSFLGDPCKISGQLFSIRPWDLIALDNQVLNTVQFKRKRVIVDVPHRRRIPGSSVYSDLMIAKISAWMYIGRDEFWLPILDVKNEDKHSKVTVYTANHGRNDYWPQETRYYFFNDKFESNRKGYPLSTNF